MNKLFVSHDGKSLQQKIDLLERDASYVKDKARFTAIVDAIQQARITMASDPVSAWSSYYAANREFSLARYNQQLLFFRKGEAGWISTAYIAVLCLFVLFLRLSSILQDHQLISSALLALAAGGIGGATVVLSQIVGMEVDTQGITAQMTWYAVKPILGAVMGLVTYLALLTTVSLFADNFKLSTPPGVFLIGFLAGYFEWFSTRILQQTMDGIRSLDSSTKEQAPTVTASPSSQTICVDAEVSFSASANGSPEPTVQWQVSSDGKNFTNVNGATSPTYTLTPKLDDNGKQYRAVFTNSVSSAYSDIATLTVNSAPIITTQPADQNLAAGTPATFVAAASGTPTPTVQWEERNGQNAIFTAVSNATSPTHTFTPQPTDNGKQYRAVFVNGCGKAETAPARLTII